MNLTTIADAEEELSFAKKAAEYFSEHPETWSLAPGNIVPGCLLALRFGANDDCVVVFRLDENCEVKNYQQAIKKLEE